MFLSLLVAAYLRGDATSVCVMQALANMCQVRLLCIFDTWAWYLSYAPR